MVVVVVGGKLGFWGGKALNKRKKEGGNMFSSKKESPFCPPVLCSTLSFDPPLHSPPTSEQPPQLTGSGTSAGYHTSESFPISGHRFLIYIPTVWCVYVQSVATGSRWGRRESDRKERGRK